MDTGRNSTGGENDKRDSASTDRIIKGLDGTPYSFGRTSNEESTRGDGSTRSSIGTEEGVPKFTRPPTLEEFGWDENKGEAKTRSPRGPASKNIVSPKTTPGINAKTCGNIAGGIVDAISFVLTHSPALALNDEEEKEMGEALYETISNFPATSLSVKAVNYFAPWAGVIHIGSKIIWKRFAFIANVKNMQKQAKVQEDRNPFPNERGVVFAPDPSLVNRNG